MKEALKELVISGVSKEDNKFEDLKQYVLQITKDIYAGINEFDIDYTHWISEDESLQLVVHMTSEAKREQVMVRAIWSDKSFRKIRRGIPRSLRPLLSLTI